MPNRAGTAFHLLLVLAGALLVATVAL